MVYFPCFLFPSYFSFAESKRGRPFVKQLTDVFEKQTCSSPADHVLNKSKSEDQIRLLMTQHITVCRISWRSHYRAKRSVMGQLIPFLQRIICKEHLLSLYSQLLLYYYLLINLQKLLINHLLY